MPRSGVHRVGVSTTSECMLMVTRLSATDQRLEKEKGIKNSETHTGSLDDERVAQDCKGRCPAPRPPHVSVEKVDGGLLVSGIVIFNSCQFILPAFGCLFLIVGSVLTVTSYQGVSTSEKVQQYIDRVEFTKNSQILGPICLIVASLMIISGLILCVLSKRAQLKQQRIGFHCPVHGDFYPSNAVPTSFMKESDDRGLWCFGQKRGSDEENLVGLPPPCPHSTVSSQRSSFSSACPTSPCPAPLPFIVTSGSLSGLTTGLATMPSELVFGSIRSLSVSHDVASFPASRSPSPTPIDRVSPSPSPVHFLEDVGKVDSGIILNSPVIAKAIPEIKLVAPAPSFLTPNIHVTNKPRRKSVTILLPGEERYPSAS